MELTLANMAELDERAHFFYEWIQENIPIESLGLDMQLMYLALQNFIYNLDES